MAGGGRASPLSYPQDSGGQLLTPAAPGVLTRPQEGLQEPGFSQGREGQGAWSPERGKCEPLESGPTFDTQVTTL